MTTEERARLEKLDAMASSSGLRRKIAPVIDRVWSELNRKPKTLMTWEALPLELFGDDLPDGIQSAWIFALRAGADTGAERHPNSHQRMLTLRGQGDMRIENGRDENDEIVWQSNLLVGDGNVPLERRWISIPKTVWHRPVVGQDSDWIVLSFHTVPAAELIEEKTDEDGRAKQKKYLED